MKTIIIALSLLFLAACNGSTTTQVPYSDPALVAKVDALTQALAAATHADAQKFANLRLVGKPEKTTSLIATQSEFRTEAIATQSFGICPNMGTLVGFTNANGNPADALSAVAEDFKQCTGYVYSAILKDGTVNTAPRMFWDGPNCTGNIIEWEASGTGYNTQTLANGVVFASPVDGSILMVQAGQTPQPVQIQSAWVTSNPGCQSDIETQLAYYVTKNDTSITEIPDTGVGEVQIVSP